VGLVILLVSLHCSLTMAFESVLPIHAHHQLGANSGTAFSNLIVAFGAGALIGAFTVAGIRDDVLRGRALLVMGLGSSLSAVGLATSPSLPVALGASFLMGMTQAPFMALAAAFVQSAVPDAVRGRVSSLYVMSAIGLMAFANLGYGALADLFGSLPVIMVPSALFGGVVLLSMAGIPTLRAILWRGFGVVPAPAPVAAPSRASVP
ncbi:MAG: MFS transporter, partial [Chloroflexi bacterium]|nr:MFS transporter [Chloroflexota bacterium]